MKQSTYAIIIVLIITGFFILFSFYTTSSSPIFAITSTPIEQVKEEMNQAKYIRFITTIGQTDFDEILFTFQWSEYRLFTVLSASNEEAQLSKELNITRLQDYNKKKK